MSPNLFTTLWISLKFEVGLAFFEVLISCKSPWLKLLGFPLPCCYGWTLRSVCKRFHTFSTQLLENTWCLHLLHAFLTNSSTIDFRKSSESAQPLMYVLPFALKLPILWRCSRLKWSQFGRLSLQATWHDDLLPLEMQQVALYNIIVLMSKPRHQTPSVSHHNW